MKVLLVVMSLLSFSAISAAEITEPVTQQPIVHSKQTVALHFADVLLDAATPKRARCTTASTQSAENRLCPGYRGDVSNAVFELSGKPYGLVNVFVDSSASTVDGIRFRPLLIQGTQLRLDAKGNGRYQLAGELMMVARPANDAISYQYNIEFYAQ